MGIRALLLASVLVVPGLAAADEPPPPPAAPQIEERSPVVAFGLSAGVTAIGFSMFFTGNTGGIGAGVLLFAVGPTTGHWYAGRAGNGGTVARILGVGMMAVGISQMEIGLDGDGDDDGGGLFVAGITLYSVAAVYEIFTAPGAAYRYNERQRSRYAVTPLVSPQSTGLALAGSF